MKATGLDRALQALGPFLGDLVVCAGRGPGISIAAALRRNLYIPPSSAVGPYSDGTATSLSRR